MKRLLLLSVVVVLLLAACAPPAPEKVVETVIVEKEVVIEKVVVETVVVEKEVVVKEIAQVTPTPAPEEPTEKVFYMGNCEPTMGLDPATAGTSASLRALEFMHDSLWEWDENYKPKPWMAESWDIKDKYKVYTFHLRSDLKFSDGSPITSEDVKFSFERMAESELWKARLEAIESIETPDPLTVVLNMSRSVPEFMILPGVNVNYFIVSKAAIEAGADLSNPGSVVSGPFTLEEWVPKSHLVLARNPYWWGLKAMNYPKFSEIMWRFNEDSTAGVVAVESGAADAFNPFPAKDSMRMAFVPGVVLYTATAANMRGFAMDRSKPPFNDKRVRQAMGLATKPVEATDVCWFSGASNLWGSIVHEWQDDWYSGVAPWKEPREAKLAEARALLDEAGWRDEDGDGIREAHGIEGMDEGTLFEVSVPFEANWPQSECHTLLFQDWMRDIGIAINPDRYDPGSFWTDVIAGKFQMWHYGHGTHLWIPQAFQLVFHTDGAYNQYSFHGSDPDLDAMIDELLAETDMEKMKALVHEIEVYLADNQFIIATGSQNQLHVLNSDVKGYYLLPNDSNRALIMSDIPGR